MLHAAIATRKSFESFKVMLQIQSHFNMMKKFLYLSKQFAFHSSFDELGKAKQAKSDFNFGAK
jgi:hypothetical protein